MLKIEEIRHALVQKYNYTNEQINNLSKKELKELLEAAEAAENTLNFVSTEGTSLDNGALETTVMNEVAEESKPNITDPNWTEYVLSQFTENEKDKGMPKVDGLRRVAHLLLGPFSEDTQVIQCPTTDNAGRATVVVRIEFKDKTYFSGVADVYSGNTDRKFAVHPTATAETRAEGRALRKALKLTKVLSAEELYGADQDEPDGVSSERIPSGMVNSLKIMSDRAGVDLIKVAVKLGYNIELAEDLTRSQALKISDQLGKYQSKREEVPDEVRK